MTLANYLVILTSLIALAGVIVAQRMARGAQREMYPKDVIADLRIEVAGLREEVSDVVNDNRLLQDYVHQLRSDLSDAGLPVRPWPPGLTS